MNLILRSKSMVKNYNTCAGVGDQNVTTCPRFSCDFRSDCGCVRDYMTDDNHTPGGGYRG